MRPLKLITFSLLKYLFDHCNRGWCLLCTVLNIEVLQIIIVYLCHCKNLDHTFLCFSCWKIFFFFQISSSCFNKFRARNRNENKIRTTKGFYRVSFMILSNSIFRAIKFSIATFGERCDKLSNIKSIILHFILHWCI